MTSFKYCLDESGILYLFVFVLMLLHQRLHQTCQTLGICRRPLLILFLCQIAAELSDEVHLLPLEEILLVLCLEQLGEDLSD